MSLAEFANKGITFFINAYLARILEVDGFGIVASITAIFAYLLVFINLGFDTVGVRSIVSNSDNQEIDVNNIFSLKVILSLFALILLVIYISLVEQPMLVKIALLMGSLQLIAATIQMDWFFQAIGKFEILGIRMVLIGLVTLIGVLCFVHSKEDIPLYIIIVGTSALINNLWLSGIYIKKYAKIKFQLVRKYWQKLLKESVTIGLSQFVIGIISFFGIMVLSSFSGDHATGLFSAAFKILLVCYLPSNIIQYTLAPSFSKAKSIEEKKTVAIRSIKMLMFCGAILAAVIFAFPEFFICIIFGDHFLASTPILRILMCDLLIVYYGNSIVPLIMYWNGEKKIMYAYILAAIVCIGLNLLLITYFSTIGAAFATLATEITIFIIMSVLLFKDIKQLYIHIFLKFTAIAIIAVIIGKSLFALIAFPNYYFQLIGIVIAFLAYMVFVVLFKVIDKSEIKRLLGRDK